MRNFANIAFASLCVIAAPFAVHAEIMSAPDAFSAVNTGDMVLIDIRSPEEWDQTGAGRCCFDDA